jgi:hypothetical protein
MIFKSDSQRRAVFSKMNKPDYSQATWQKNVAGVPKYKIDSYYRSIWNKLTSKSITI